MTTVASVAVDLSPIITQLVLPLVGAVATGLAGLLMAKLAAVAHITVQDSQRQVVNDAITNGIALAQKKLAPGEVLNVDAAVAQVLNYVIPKVPDALKALNVDPDHLADVVKAKLPTS